MSINNGSGEVGVLAKEGSGVAGIGIDPNGNGMATVGAKEGNGSVILSLENGDGVVLTSDQKGNTYKSTMEKYTIKNQ